MANIRKWLLSNFHNFPFQSVFRLNVSLQIWFVFQMFVSVTNYARACALRYFVPSFEFCLQTEISSHHITSVTYGLVRLIDYILMELGHNLNFINCRKEFHAPVTQQFFTRKNYSDRKQILVFHQPFLPIKLGITLDLVSFRNYFGWFMQAKW